MKFIEVTDNNTNKRMLVNTANIVRVYFRTLNTDTYTMIEVVGDKMIMVKESYLDVKKMIM